MVYNFFYVLLSLKEGCMCVCMLEGLMFDVDSVYTYRKIFSRL